MAATVKEDRPTQGDSGLQLASSAPSTGQTALIKDEADTSAILKQKVMNQSLLEASLDRQLDEIADKWSQPCYNEKLKRTATFAPSLLRDFFTIRSLPDDKNFRLELDSGLLNVLVLLRRKPFISADFVEKTSMLLILNRVRKE